MAAVIKMVKETAEQAAARSLQQATEDALAEAFENERAGQLRFDQSRRTWLIYEPASGIWRPDRKEQVLYDVRCFVRARNPNNEARLGKAAVVLNVERLARMREGFAITGDELDADPFILGTPHGPYDLRTAERLEADPDLLITRSTSVAPDFAVPSLWLKFLAEATGNAQEVIDYLQRLAGYCLTGSTREEQLTFLFGSGRNGKGTFLGALRDITGDYGRSTDMSTFLESRSDRNKADLAVLAGRRLVIAQETNEGKKWDGQRIKTVTGRDEVEARFLYANSFVFKPTFKLLIASNHKPRIPTVDESWRRRLHLLPFDKTPAAPDPQLKEKLAAEYPQILGWMIEGAEWWYREGLMVPEAVTAASAQYLQEEDVVLLWFEECCIAKSGAVTERKAMMASLIAWCKDMNHRAPTGHALTRWLKVRGIEQDMKKPSRPYLGVGLLAAADGVFPSGAASSAGAWGYSKDSQDDDLPH